MQLKQANALLAGSMAVVALVVAAACYLIFIGRGKASVFFQYLLFSQ